MRLEPSSGGVAIGLGCKGLGRKTLYLFLGGKGLGIQQGMSVWVGSPKLVVRYVGVVRLFFLIGLLLFGYGIGMWFGEDQRIFIFTKTHV